MPLLACHPDTPTTAVKSIEGIVSRADPAILTLHFALVGDLAKLNIPTPQPARFRDQLWMHCCFEAFLRVDDEPAYYEFNFSPSGEWAAYHFEDYRQRSVAPQDFSPPRIKRHDAEGSIEITVELDLHSLALIGRTPLKLGLSAVVEDSNGLLSYWALRHAPGKPDFHHRDMFALAIGGL